MTRSLMARRVQYASLALVLAVTSTGVAGCKAGKKQNNKSNGSGDYTADDAAHAHPDGGACGGG